MQKKYYQHWMNRIEKRLNEPALNESGDIEKFKWKDDEYIKWFIAPILEYGLNEEKRMKETFKNQKYYCVNCDGWFKSKKEKNHHRCNLK